MAKEKEETIFVPGLNQHVSVDQIANINPDIDIRDATHFMSIHHTDDIDYNKETQVFTRSLLSTAHASIEFIARGKVEGHYGKHPVRRGMPIDIAEINDDSERYENGQKYDQKYGTNTVLTKILPVTEEQYGSSFAQVKKVEESPGMFNVVNNNCNVFVNDVIQATGIPNINISKLYTGGELREHGKPVTANVLANHGACDTSFTVTESIHTNVADKYKVPEDRILAHHVDPSNPDVRFYTISPEGICPPRVLGDDTVSIKNPFLTQPTFQQENIGIASKLYSKDYPIAFGNPGLSNHNPLVNGATLDLSVPKPSFQVRDSIRGKSSFGFKPLGFTSSGSGVDIPTRSEFGVSYFDPPIVEFPLLKQRIYFGSGADWFNGQSEFERTVEFVNRGFGLLKAQAQRLKDNAITKSDHITADIFTEQAWAEDAEWHRELAIKNNDHGEHGIEFRGKQLQGYYRNIARLLEELETEAQRIKDSAITPSEHLKADIVMNKFLLTMHEEMRVIAVKKK